MMSFKKTLEWKAKSKGELSIPPALSEAYFLSRLGQFTWHEYRTTPHYLIEQIEFIWHLQNLADKKANSGK